MAMYYVYILQSEIDKKLYIGYTNDLKKRLAEHQNGKSAATSPRRPFKLIYYEAYVSMQDAKHRESNLKLQARALEGLKRRIPDCIET